MKVGETVYWKWGNGFAEAKVSSIHFEKVSIETKGKVITRNGTSVNPALILRNKNGIRIVKLASEVVVDANI